MSEIECSNPPENLTDRKMRCFYIEAMSKKKSEAQQKIFFRDALKKTKNWSNMKKSKNFNENHMIFHGNFLTFFTFEKISKNFNFLFFDREKIIFFSKLKKKLGYSFDVENCNLSIYEVFNSFWAR